MEVPPPEMLELPGGPAVLEWRRSARARRVSLRIDPRGGAIVVTLPMRASRRAGMALVMSHTDWLADRLAALPDAVRFIDGAIIPIGGPVIFNALIIMFLIPLALKGVKYRAVGAAALLRRNLLIYGLGGLIVPFIGIKAIDVVLVALNLA